MAEGSIILVKVVRFIERSFILAICAYCLSCSAERLPPVDFPDFWSSFRQAVINENYSALQSYSKLPLELRGVYDGQPARLIGEDAFSETMKEILEQPVFKTVDNTLTERPLKAVIEEKAFIDEDEWKGRQQVHVTQFVFYQIDGRWKLVRAFLE